MDARDKSKEYCKGQKYARIKLKLKLSFFQKHIIFSSACLPAPYSQHLPQWHKSCLGFSLFSHTASQNLRSNHVITLERKLWQCFCFFVGFFCVCFCENSKRYVPASSLQDFAATDLSVPATRWVHTCPPAAGPVLVWGAGRESRSAAGPAACCWWTPSSAPPSGTAGFLSPWGERRRHVFLKHCGKMRRWRRQRGEISCNYGSGARREGRAQNGAED